MERRMMVVLLSLLFVAGWAYAAEQQPAAPAKPLTEAQAKEAQFNDFLKQNKEAWVAKDYPKAIELLRKASELAPNLCGVTYNLACLYALNGQKAEALDCLERSVKQGYDNAKHMQEDGDIASLREEPRFKAAVAKAQAINGIFVASPAAVAKATKERQPGAIARDKEKLEKLKTFVNTGSEAWKAKDYAKAVECFEGACKISPLSPEISYNLACLYALSGRKDDALGCLDKTINNNYLDTQHMLQDKDLDSLREDPRFKQLIAKTEALKKAPVNLSAYAGAGSLGAMAALSLGVTVHEAGYILTAHYSAVDGGGAVQCDGKQFPYRVVVSMPEIDIALLKVDLPDGKPMLAMPIGRSSDVAVGDSLALVVRPLTQFAISTGLVCAMGLASSHDPQSAVGWQYPQGLFWISSSANYGLSGAAAVNRAGELVGVVTAVPMERNPMMAVPADAICEQMVKALAPERFAFLRLGLEVHPLGQPQVAAVEAGSPAEKAGLKVGDMMLKVAGTPVQNAIQFYLSVAEQKKAGPVAMEIRRGQETSTVTVALEGLPARGAEPDVQGLANGLKCKVYSGQWTKLPDFDKLKETETKTVPEVTHKVGPAAGDFGAVYEGYIQVSADGLYEFSNVTLGSVDKDGSRLWIGDKLVVDNDACGVSPSGLVAVIHTGCIRLKAGTHPIKIAYFHQGKGQGLLAVLWSGPGMATRQKISKDALFCKP